MKMLFFHTWRSFLRSMQGSVCFRALLGLIRYRYYQGRLWVKSFEEDTTHGTN